MTPGRTALSADNAAAVAPQYLRLSRGWWWWEVDPVGAGSPLRIQKRGRQEFRSAVVHSDFPVGMVDHPVVKHVISNSRRWAANSDREWL
jgi:hypothetical protein